MPNPDGRISTRDLCNDVVSTRTIADGAVDGNKLADGAVDSITKFASGITPVQVVSSLPGSASEGDVAYLTTDNKLYRYDGSSWTAAVETVDLVGTITADGIASGSALPGTGTVGDLFFLTTDDKLYRYDGSNWIATVATTDLTGTISEGQIADGAVSIAKFASGIQPVQVVSSLPGSASEGDVAYLTTDNKLYRYDGSNWIAAVDTSDLTGTISTTQITDGAISTPKLAANAVTTAKLAAGAVTANEIAANTITAGQIAAGAISTDELAANAVTVEKLVVGSFDNLVSNPGFEADTIGGSGDPHQYTTNSEAAWSTETTLVRSGNRAARIDWTSANSGYKEIILDGNPSTVSKHQTATEGDTFYVEAWARTVDGTTVPEKSPYIAIQFRDADGTSLSSTAARWSTLSSTWQRQSVTATAPAGTAYMVAIIGFSNSDTISSGKVAILDDVYARRMVEGDIIVDGAITASKIAANTITANEIASGTITSTEIATDTITAGQIAAGTITSAEIASGTITANEIASGTITANEIASNTITSAKIAANTITSNEIAANTITAGEIAAGAVSTTELAASAVTADKIASGTITTDKLIVGSFDNLIPDPGFETGGTSSHEYVNTGGTWTVRTTSSDSVAPRSGAYQAQYDPSGQTGTAYLTFGGGLTVAKHHAATEGDKFHFEAYVRGGDLSTGSTTPNVSVQAVFLDETGSSTGVTAGTGSRPAISTTWETRTVDATAPAGTVAVAFRVAVAADGAGSPIVCVDDAYARRQVGTAIIEDASITNAKISSLSADKITTGTLDASTVTVTNLNASNINTGTLNGINVRTTSSGIRIQINPTTNKLEFTNSSGTSIADIYTDGTDLIISTVDAVTFATGGTISFDNSVVVGTSLTLFATGGIDAAGTVYTTQVDSSSSLYLDAGSASTLYLRHGTTSKLQISSGGVSAYIIGPNALRLLRAGAADSGGTGYRMVLVSN